MRFNCKLPQEKNQVIRTVLTSVQQHGQTPLFSRSLWDAAKQNRAVCGCSLHDVDAELPGLDLKSKKLINFSHAQKYRMGKIGQNMV